MIKYLKFMWVKENYQHMPIKLMKYMDYKLVGHPTSVIKPTCRNNRTPWHQRTCLHYLYNLKELQSASKVTVFQNHSKMIKLLTLFSIILVLTTVNCENYDYSIDVSSPTSPSDPCSDYISLTFAGRNVKSNSNFYLRWGCIFLKSVVAIFCRTKLSIENDRIKV